MTPKELFELIEKLIEKHGKEQVLSTLKNIIKIFEEKR